MSNIVYIATSLDGYIADRNGKLDWLEMVPNPEGDDMGWSDFIAKVDAMIMGRNTFETVLSFGVDWPYTVPVFVYSKSLKQIPEELSDRVFIINGSVEEVVKIVNDKGYNNIYVDGGRTIQSFLKANLIDEMIITSIPVLLGGGVKLFADLPQHIEWSLQGSKVLLNQLVMSHYKRK